MRPLAPAGIYVNMVDAKSPVNPLFLREQELDRGMELLFFAYRDFVAESDRILAPLGLGRAHHRAIYFVGRDPGIPFARLLGILKITKQSLSRVVGELARGGYVARARGGGDGRQRLLTLTDRGRELERRLSQALRGRLARAYRAAGGEAVEGFSSVLYGLMTEEDRARLRGRRAA